MMKSIRDALTSNVPWLVLLALLFIFYLASPNFITPDNLNNILIQNAYLLVVSFGVTLIMMSGEMDLSVGYQISLIAVLVGMALNKGVPGYLCLAMAVAVGMIYCAINCVLANRLRLPLLVVSLATMTIGQGLSFVISGAYSYYGFPASFREIGQGSIGWVSFPVLIALACFIVATVVLNKTYFGRYVYAIGGNPEASKLSGIDVPRMRLVISLIEGACIGLSSVMLVAKLGSAQSTMGPGTEFTVLTAVILGGVSIRGGEGKVSGTVAGILILAILSNGMQLAGMGTYPQYIAKGLIMLLAIGIDVLNLNARQKYDIAIAHNVQSDKE
jgi:ribose transport system permease protein